MYIYIYIILIYIYTYDMYIYMVYIDIIPTTIMMSKDLLEFKGIAWGYVMQPTILGINCYKQRLDLGDG